MTKREEFRNVRRRSFTQISNEVVNNPDLTLQEKGLLAIFLSNSETWEPNMKEIMSRSANGRDAHYKAINNLIDNGYFARVEIMNEKTNRFEKMVYIFSDSKEDVEVALEDYQKNKYALINKTRKKEKTVEKPVNTPVPENQDAEKKPFTENQDTENEYPANQYNNNTNTNNTNLNNTKDINLSIKEVEKLDLPTSIKTALQKQIDRLNQFNINVQEIELHFHAVKDTYTLSEYTYVLNALLQKLEQSPDDFASVLNNWLKRNREMQNKVAEKKVAPGSKPIREELKPEWIGNDAAANGPEEQSEDFLKRKEALQERLKRKYAKKKVQ